MILPHVDKATVAQDIIDPVRNGFAVREAEKVVDIDRNRVSRWLPLPSVVLERPDQFFLLAIDRDDRRSLSLSRRTLLRDVRELGIALGMTGPFQDLLVRLEGIVALPQHVTDGRLSHAVPA